MMDYPRILLRLEGAVAFVTGIWLYATYGQSWLLFAILFFVPDVSIVGYLANARIGAILYNVAHTYVLSVGVAGIAVVIEEPVVLAIALIWVSHIGFDRMLGYGLKYPMQFQDTHLGVIGDTANYEQSAR